MVRWRSSYANGHQRKTTTNHIPPLIFNDNDSSARNPNKSAMTQQMEANEVRTLTDKRRFMYKWVQMVYAQVMVRKVFEFFLWHWKPVGRSSPSL
ncbi:hypothetical protein GQ55_6G107900 [Panicum hallii var. hallii]|jgi:hypothetical protein|uniref:Uncharacterized protein n=1 Tax=Panicum hallii var. hallii TaxID=1504633 RepID=A0A2T7D5P9_9POAL|nr:hypothetical protein GQ55_6G107900 [Panicum hallii var. hallii]